MKITDTYVEVQIKNLTTRLIPVTDTIIRCISSKDAIQAERDSLMIEKKSYPAVSFEAEEKEGTVTIKTKKVQAQISKETGEITWMHPDGSLWLLEKGRELTREDVIHYTTGGEAPEIKRVKTVDGERNFIQNLKPEVVRSAYRGRLSEN